MGPDSEKELEAHNNGQIQHLSSPSLHFHCDADDYTCIVLTMQTGHSRQISGNDAQVELAKLLRSPHVALLI